MLSSLRGKTQFLRRVLARPFVALRISANSLSLIGIFATIMAALCLRCGNELPAFALAIFGLFTDFIDGEVARASGQQTPFGNYLDAVGDRLREAILLFGLLPCAPNLVMLALAGSLLTSFAKARVGLVIVTDNHDWPGVGDFPDRALLISIAYFFPHQNMFVLIGLALLAWYAFFARLRYARHLVERAGDGGVLPYLNEVDDSH